MLVSAFGYGVSKPERRVSLTSNIPFSHREDSIICHIYF